MGSYYDELGGMLTSLISAILTFIAFQQWRTNEKSRRDKFYERRYKFYDELLSTLKHLAITGEVKEETIDRHNKLFSLLEGSRFLFDDKVYELLKEALTVSAGFLAFSPLARRGINGVDGEEKSYAQKVFEAEKRAAELSGRDSKELYNLFSPYLKIERRWEEELMDCKDSLVRGLKNMF